MSFRRVFALASTLRSPELGITGQGVRFAIAGGTVALVYVLTTTGLHELVGLPFEVALPIGYVLSVSLHFTLQRLLVWAHDSDFALAVHGQLARYLPLAGAQYAVTAASTGILPGLLHVDVEYVYLVTFVIVTGANFLIFRHGVFHAA